MRELRGLGVWLSIDDFGTGFSSLSYLQKMPVQTLKIDRKFVEHVPERQGDAKLLRSIIAMGHALGVEIVAEGVERDEQWQFLCSEGCDQVQGFLFAPPVRGADFVSALCAGR
jgi:EAL domain-containing protein (putative c-di-GMP-specific phosphodiesterase class I)